MPPTHIHHASPTQGSRAGRERIYHGARGERHRFEVTGLPKDHLGAAKPLDERDHPMEPSVLPNSHKARVFGDSFSVLIWRRGCLA